MGRGQVVRQRLLVPSFVGSNPTAPASNYSDAMTTNNSITISSQKKYSYLFIILGTLALITFVLLLFDASFQDSILLLLFLSLVLLGIGVINLRKTLTLQDNILSIGKVFGKTSIDLTKLVSVKSAGLKEILTLLFTRGPIWGSVSFVLIDSEGNKALVDMTIYSQADIHTIFPTLERYIMNENIEKDKRTLQLLEIYSKVK
jgi:hypothetical protein